MPRRSTRKAPIVEEIMSYDNVPFAVAASFIGWSDVSIRNALQQGRAPFGCAAQNEATGTWSYNISPGLLVKYKNGELPAWSLNDVVKLAMTGINDVLQMQKEAAAALLVGHSGPSRQPYGG